MDSRKLRPSLIQETTNKRLTTREFGLQTTAQAKNRLCGKLKIKMKNLAKTKERDPNLDNKAVRLYRDVVHLQANYLQRAEIALVVTNERIWEVVLLEWMLSGYNPKNVLGMLKVYQSMNGGSQL